MDIYGENRQGRFSWILKNIERVIVFFFFFYFWNKMDAWILKSSRVRVVFQDFGSDIVGFWGSVFRVFDVIFSN